MANAISTAPPRLPALPHDLEQRLTEHARASRGALSRNTERALRADTAVFSDWCLEHGITSLPASPETVAAFVDAMSAERKPATVRRYVSSIATLHRAADLESPTRHELVRLALRRMGRVNGVAQQQARPLNRSQVDRMLGAAGKNLSDLRDKALLAVAYDTLARRAELVAIDVGDVQRAEDGSGTVTIRRSKTDQEGAGTVRYVAPDTVRAVDLYVSAAGITAGALFRRIRRFGALGNRLEAGSVARIFRRMARSAGIDPSGISGHSTRVGAAQDQVAAGVELPAVMQSGGWKSPAMPARYSQHLLAGRGGAAQLARSQGRT